MGEVERIRPSLGSTFGHDLGQRVATVNDGKGKRHHRDEAEQSNDDALELHDQLVNEPKYPTVNLSLESTDHLDLSA